MNKIIELREKRAKLWESTKAFLDSRRNENGLLSAEDTASYERMEQDVVDLGKEIERLERQAVMDLELSKATSSPLFTTPDNTRDEEKQGRGSNEYKKAFWNNMRNNSSQEIRNSLKIGTDSEGGYLAPDEFEKILVEGLLEENFFRTLATIINTSSGDRKIPVVASKGTATWIDEEAPIQESDDSFGQISISAYKLATMIKVSEELLNDSVFNLESYIAKEFARRIGSAEEEAFLIGNGTGKPTGIFNDTGGAGIGTTASTQSTIKIDEIIDLFYSLKSPYRKKATFIMNDSTVKEIRKLKDGNGQYIWQPSITAGEPDTILNRPVKTSSYVPGLAAGAKPIAFGDFSYYWIADRQGRSFQRLNELYAVTGQIGFKASQRVDGKLILPEAIKVLQMKA
ncbi:MAG TPA: phage major capsid protein [Gallicola sp.]|nr:phage major capsid protein [Gallicola sp.]